jgi:predicted esterase
MKSLNSLFTDLRGAGLDPERVLLVGFSQGACLSLEFAARNPQRYGGIAALSGGLIGPSGSDLFHSGSLAETPVFIGCSDIDPHIPKSRVLESEQVLQSMGAKVTTQIYPGMGHTINEDELERLGVMARVL